MGSARGMTHRWVDVGGLRLHYVEAGTGPLAPPTDPAGGAFTAQDIDRYVAAASQPGAMGAAINYYRAAVRANPLAQAHTLRRVDIPTLIIMGEQDRYLGRELAEPTPPGSRRCRSSGSPRQATGCRPTPPSGSTSSWWTSSSPSAAKTRESAQLRRGTALSDRNRLELRSAAALDIVARLP